MRRSILMLWIITCLLITSSTVIATSTKITDFNPKNIAVAEVKMWKAYYDNDYPQLALSMVNSLVAQFNVSYYQAIAISFPAVKAARQFHRLSYGTPDAVYQRQVIPDLILYYQRLKQATQRNDWQPEALAQAELAWWVARRENQQQKIEFVGTKIADLYSLLYGVRNENIARAGYLRAQAADLRDRQSNQKGIDWQTIEDRLALSYHFLKLGINNN